MRSELVQITPSLAEHFLSKNRVNRTINYSRVKGYSTLMKNGKWRLTHQGIAFYEDDSIADGQHRLLGIIDSRMTILMMVTYGLKKESSLAIDYHRPRSIVDGIKIGGFSDWIDFKHIALINTIAENRKLTSDESIAWLEKMKDSVHFATTRLSPKRYLTNSSSQAGVAIAHYNGVDQDLLERFCNVFLNGVTENKYESSIIKLRDEFLSNPSQGRAVKIEKFYKTQRVISALLKKETLTRLIDPKESIWVFNEGIL